MSVAKLCEALEEQGTRNKEQRPKLKDQSLKTKDLKSKRVHGAEFNEEESVTYEQLLNEQRTTNNDSTNHQLNASAPQRLNASTPKPLHSLEVFTTLANGKSELNVRPNEKQIIDGVTVTYFNRITKDHTHFSPALLLALRREIRNGLKNKPACRTGGEQRIKNTNSLNITCKKLKTNNEQRTTNDDLIIHIHAWWNLVSIFSCAIAKWYKIPVVLSPRGMLTNYSQQNRNSFLKKIIHKILGKNLLSYCHIHATSEMEKRDILSFIQPKSLTVIPNLVELGETKDQSLKTKDRETNKHSKRAENTVTSTVFRPSFLEPSTNNDKRVTTNEQRPFKLIFLSRIEEKKGLPLLFEALSTLEINWQLTIAGSGEEEYVESLKLCQRHPFGKSLKLAANIDWVGQVKNEEKFKLLAEHDLMVLTSYNENFANVVVESLSVGTPVLISNQVGLADYVAQNNFGWIAELNPNAIKDKILSAYHNVERRNFIREHTPKIITDHFSDNLVNRYIELYQTIL